MEELKTLDIDALLTYDFDALSPQQKSFDLMGNNDFLTDNLDMPQGTQFFEVSFGNETNQSKCLKIKTNWIKVTKKIMHSSSMTQTKSKWGRIWVKKLPGNQQWKWSKPHQFSPFYM